MSKIDFFEQQRYNQRKTFFLIFIFILFFAAIGYAIDVAYIGAQFPYVTVIALVLASINSAIAYFNGDKLVLLSLGARPAVGSELKIQQLNNVVAEMSIAAGLTKPPNVYIMDETSPNAFATGRDENHASVCVTTGLLETMNREELQGVIAHEIAHIRNRDILTMTIVSALVGAIVLLSDYARRIFYYGGIGTKRSNSDRRKSSAGGLVVLIILLLAIIAPIIARLMALAISRSREYMADAGSVEFTRNPKALASALRKIANHYDKVVDKATDGTAHLFISDPKSRALSSKEGFFAELFSTHPPINKRIKILLEMAGAPLPQ